MEISLKYMDNESYENVYNNCVFGPTFGHYYQLKDWITAYMFLRTSCSLEYPKDALLFVDKWIYEYQRWHLMGIVGFYVGAYQEGKEGCLRAIEFGEEIDLNKNNLKFYLDKV